MTIITGSRDAAFLPQQHFWSKLGQLKFDLILYSYHFSACVGFLRWSRIGTAVLTAFATGAWIQWKDIACINTICPIIILVLQTFNAGVEFLPYDNRKQELRELVDSLEPLYNEMERDWGLIVLGALTVEQIENKAYEYQNRRTSIAKYYLKNDAISNKGWIVQKAKKEADKYMASLG